MRVVTNLPDLRSYFDTLLLFCELSQQCERVQLLTTCDAELPPELAERYPRLQLIPLPRRGWRGHALDWLQRGAARGEFEIVHDLLGALSPFFLTAPAARSYRLVNTQLTTNWGWFQRVRYRDVGFGRRYVQNRIVSLWRDRQLAARADALVVLGPGHECDLLHAHPISPDRIHWIPAETDLDHFCPDPRITRQPGRLIFVGQSARTKGTPLLFRLLHALIERAPERALELHLVGPVALYERRWFAAAVEREALGGRLKLVPPLPRAQLPDVYRAADIFLLPSLFEGSPRALREALACGCRAVVSELPGHRGIDPHGAFLSFAPDDQLEPWVEATEALLEESPSAATRRRRRAAERLQSAHSPVAVARTYRALFQSLLSQAPRPR